MDSVSWKKSLVEIGRTALIAVLFFLSLTSFVSRFEVSGPSMHPTLKDGERLLVWNTHGVDTPKRGQIIVFKNVEGDPRDLVKRVIGLPGDQVRTVEDQVFINGILLDEPYAHGARSSKMEEWTVPARTVFVVGDNRMESYDSRDWGFLPFENVVGTVFFRYSPVSAFGIIRR